MMTWGSIIHDCLQLVHVQLTTQVLKPHTGPLLLKDMSDAHALGCGRNVIQVLNAYTQIQYICSSGQVCT